MLANFGNLFGIDGLLMLGCCMTVVIVGAVIGGVVFFIVRSKQRKESQGSEIPRV